MLRMEAVTVAFGDVVALDGVNLDADTGSTTVVMGPSGCGKSTLLRVVAGLQPIEAGQVTWMDRSLDGKAPHERGFGLMFQDYALFPHRTVGANVAFGLRMARWDGAAIRDRVGQLLDMVGLAGYAGRSVGNLSGGEQQRVALARALAPSPHLLMLDEPIGALDRDLRSQLMMEMRNIFRDLGLTVVYVTHDEQEAFSLADHIAVMRAGRIVRSSTPEDVWRNPGSAFTARFIGHENVLDEVAAGRLATIGLLPSAHPISIAPPAITATPRSEGPGQVVDSRFVSGTYRTTITVGGVTLIAEHRGPMPPGSAVAIDINGSGLTRLDRER